MRGIPFGILLPLGILTGCSEQASIPAPRPLQVISNFFLKETERGVTQWSLDAKEATLHEPSGVDLVSPHLNIFEKGQPATSLQAKSGVYEESTRDIHLKEDVVVVSSDPESNAPTTIYTDALDYSSKDQKFRTLQPVLIKRQGSTMRGKGLVANQDLSEIHVLQQESILR